VGLIAVVAVVAGPGLVPAGAATAAQTDPTVAEAEAALRQAQATAQDAAERFQQATGRLDALRDQIAATEDRIAAARLRAEELRGEARARAVSAYLRRDAASDVVSMVLGEGRVLDPARRTAFLQHANEQADGMLADLAEVEDDLEEQTRNLRDQQTRETDTLERVRAERATLEAAVAEADRTYQALVDRLAREAQSRAEAERAARAATTPPRTATPVGPPVSGLVCPVRGPFTDDYGDPRSGGRSHGGIDIFAGFGTPVVAVRPGTLSFETGGAGGNAAYVSADDGNTYYYAHFSQFAGGGRSVAQGEVIGYVGQTGSATTPHLHFEIRTPRGAINPYATLVAVC